jgi:hypothetical protein
LTTSEFIDATLAKNRDRAAAELLVKKKKTLTTSEFIDATLAKIETKLLLNCSSKKNIDYERVHRRDLSKNRDRAAAELLVKKKH